MTHRSTCSQSVGKIMAAVCIMVCLPLGSCIHFEKKIPGPEAVTGWIVYWDAKRGLEELEKHGARFTHVSCYAYELTPQAYPVPAPHFERLKEGLQKLSGRYPFETWLTVANDVRHPDGKVIPKDPTVIRRMLARAQTRETHAAALVKAVSDLGFGGLHLDYEELKKEDEGEFRLFVDQLRRMLKKKGLGLEVVLEPVKGPTLSHGQASIVVMAYYLHGAHSGPGPLASPEFVAKTIKKGRAEDRPAVALAVGGFHWDAQNKTRVLDWFQGQTLYRKAKNRGRTLDGDVPFARFDDGSEIWLEDGFSILTKWRAAYEAGYRRLALWRLGGNGRELFSALEQMGGP